MQPIKGKDYDFSTFGGASAENFYLLDKDYEWKPDANGQDEDKIFDLLKIHPKSFVVMDSDLNNDLFQKQFEWNKVNYPDLKMGEIIEITDKPFKKSERKQKRKEEIEDLTLKSGKYIAGDSSNFYNFKIKVRESELIRNKYFKNSKIHTIECLSNLESIPVRGKSEVAIKYCKKNENKSFSEITKPECKELIVDIYNFIVDKI